MLKRFITAVLAISLFSLAVAPVLAHEGNEGDGRGLRLGLGLRAKTRLVEVRSDNDAQASVSASQRPVDLACMQTAVDAREVSLAAAFSAYADGVKAALDVRRTSLKAAWALTDRDARRDAIRAAWKAFRQSHREKREDFQKALHR